MGLRSNLFLSGVHWRYLEYPFLMYDVSLARLGLRGPDRGYQPRPGFPPERVTCLALHVSANSLADIGTLGRHSSEDRCGAKHNGSVLPVSSHSMCRLFLSSVDFLKES
jgi:hypothetical protein